MNAKSNIAVDSATAVDTLNWVLGESNRTDPDLIGDEKDPLLALLKGQPPKFIIKREQPLPEAEMLTKPQAAALMTVSVRTLDRLVTKGDIPHVVLGRRCVRFPLKALRAWLESKTKYRK